MAHRVPKWGIRSVLPWWPTPQLQQHWILSPAVPVGDWTCILALQRRPRSWCSIEGSPSKVETFLVKSHTVLCQYVDLPPLPYSPTHTHTHTHTHTTPCPYQPAPTLTYNPGATHTPSASPTITYKPLSTHLHTWPHPPTQQLDVTLLKGYLNYLKN